MKGFSSGRPRLAVRTRLTLWYTGALLAIVLVISGFSYVMLRENLIRDVDVELLMVAHMVRDTSVGETRRSQAELHEVLGPGFLDTFFRVFGADGRPEADAATTPHGPQLPPLSADMRARADSGDPVLDTVTLGGKDRVRLLTLLLVRDPQPRFIQVGVAFDDIDRALAGYLRVLAVMVPLGLALAATGGVLLARSALKPVETMSLTARRITAEDLARRVPLRGTGDELDHLAATLNGMLGRLEDAFAQTRRFAANAAHELRTPLTALRGGIEVALRADRSPDAYREVLRSSLDDIARLIRLAENLLLLSRVRADPPSARERVDLEPLVLDAVDVGLRLAEGRGVAVTLGPVEPVTVTGDASTLQRAVVNVVDNAIKYTPAGGTVEVALRRDDGHAAIAVRDTGVGIDRADLDRIFEPFVRLDAAQARDGGGTGLGLAIVRSIVAAHGGDLLVESVPGAGSTFTIRLPLGP
jgi:heavy metal sensor kinase